MHLGEDGLFSRRRALEEDLGDLRSRINKDSHYGVGIVAPTGEGMARMRRNHLVDVDTFSWNQLVGDDRTLENSTTSLLAELAIRTLGRRT